MAVIHKSVECSDQQSEKMQQQQGSATSAATPVEIAPLHTLIRLLDSIEQQQTRSDMGLACGQMVHILRKVSTPKNNDVYNQFLEKIQRIEQMLAKCCRKDVTMKIEILCALYEEISDCNRNNPPPQPVLSIVLQSLEAKQFPDAIKTILRRGPNNLNEAGLERAMHTLCKWLAHWTLSPNLGPLILTLYNELKHSHPSVLAKITSTHLQLLFRLLILPMHRRTVGPVVLYMLNMRHPCPIVPSIFTIIENVLKALEEEGTPSSQQYLDEVVNCTLQQLGQHKPKIADLDNPAFVQLVTKLYRYNNREHLGGNIAPSDVLRGSGGGSYGGDSGHPAAAVDADVVHGSAGTGDMRRLFSTRDVEERKVGLHNLGNTCYMNAVLQALFMTPFFRNDILTIDSKKGLIISPLFGHLQTLFALLQFSNRTALTPRDVLVCARPSYFLHGQQHDSSEFLGHLLDTLHEQEKARTKNLTPLKNGSDCEEVLTAVQRSFGGFTVTASTCNDCGNISERADSYRDLQLSFPPVEHQSATSSGHAGGSSWSSPSVQHLLDYYLQPERLCGDNQYYCEQCCRLADGVRVTRVVGAPPRLVLTLKHFRYDPATQLRTKILQRVLLNDRLALRTSTSKKQKTTMSSDSGSQAGAASVSNLSDDPTVFEYELYAAVVHCGVSVDSGHYYTFAREDVVITSNTGGSSSSDITASGAAQPCTNSDDDSTDMVTDEDDDSPMACAATDDESTVAASTSSSKATPPSKSFVCPRWYKFNDAVVTLAGSGPHDGGGELDYGELQSLRPPDAPYMLFYRRTDCQEEQRLQLAKLSQRLRDIVFSDNEEEESNKRGNGGGMFGLYGAGGGGGGSAGGGDSDRGGGGGGTPPSASGGCGGGNNTMGSISRFVC